MSMFNQIILTLLFALLPIAASEAVGVPLDISMTSTRNVNLESAAEPRWLDALGEDALNEAAFTLCAFLGAGILIQAMKRRNSHKSTLRKAAQKAEKLACDSPVQTSPATSPPRMRTSSQFSRWAESTRPAASGSSSSTREGNGLRKTASGTRGQGNNSESDQLATAVRSGYANQLPELLDAARLRVSASGVAGEQLQKAAAQHLLSSLRACASRRCFCEALTAYDHALPHIGDGCSTMWSLLLYSAVEAQEFSRCELFIGNLLETGMPSGNDFINMIRHHLVYQRGSEVMKRTIDGLVSKGFRLDALSRNRAISTCTQKKAMELADILAEDRIGETSMDTVGYNTLMKGYAQIQETDRCFELYEKMKSINQAPSEITFGILLDACIDSKEFVRAKEVFSDLRKSSVCVNVIHYTTFMKGLANAGHLKDADDVLDEMLHSATTKPDLVTYSTLIKAHADRGNVTDAMRVLKLMLDQHIVPDAVVFNIILTGCCVNPMEPPQIFNVFQWLTSHGLTTSTTTLSILIKALAKTNAWDSALEMLEGAPERLHIWPQARLYSQLAQSCAKVGNGKKAIEAYTAMVREAARRGNAVDDEMNSRLCRLCASSGEASMATKISQVVTRAGGYVDVSTLDDLMKEQVEMPLWRGKMVACS